MEGLTAYFSELSEHELLTPEEEQVLAKSLESEEIAIWEHVFSLFPLRALEILADGPVSTKPLGKALAEEDRKKISSAAKKFARKMRAEDPDREWLDKVLKDVGRDEVVRRHERTIAGIREEFVRSNLRLVVKMARHYDWGGMPLADLIQEGNLGLMHAVSRFDHRRGLRFSTYACWWIRHAIGRALADKARAVRIPVHMLEAQQNLEKIRAQLIRELGRPPTDGELSKAAKIPLSKLAHMHRYIMGQPISLDRPVHDEDDHTLGDVLADPDTEDETAEEHLDTEAMAHQIRELLHHLTPIEADVIRCRFGIGDGDEKTFREIGEKHELSRERIRQIQNTALEKLKRAIQQAHRGTVDI